MIIPRQRRTADAEGNRNRTAVRAVGAGKRSRGEGGGEGGARCIQGVAGLLPHDEWDGRSGVCAADRAYHALRLCRWAERAVGKRRAGRQNHRLFSTCYGLAELRRGQGLACTAVGLGLASRRHLRERAAYGPGAEEWASVGGEPAKSEA